MEGLAWKMRTASQGMSLARKGFGTIVRKKSGK